MEKETAKLEMADAVFRRGAEAFALGKYQDTIKEMTLCLSMEKAEEYQYLDTDAYNMLGMLFSFSGYETAALDYYLLALEAAQKIENISGEVSSLLNIGLLYQGCKEYSRAMSYYKRAKEVAEHDLRSHDILLLLYTSIQIAQLYCRMEQFSEARRFYTEVDNYYRIVMKDEFLLPKAILDILLAQEAGTYEKVHALAEEVTEHLQQDEQYVEQIDFYADICELLFGYGYAKETQRILLLLSEKIKDTDFFRLKMRVGLIETDYQKIYGKEEDYKESCMRYIVLHEQYEKALHQLQRENLENVDGLQRLEEQKREFERRSICDLATGLLNKKAFRHEVEKELLEYSRATTNAMVFLDIDNFKLMNDSYGHLLGDEVIRMLADKIKTYFKDNCICGRFGGDEFTIFISKVEDILGIEEHIEKFREEFARIGFGKGSNIHATLSIGVSYNKGMRVSYQALLSCADEALEKAKEYGKNRVSFYEIKRGIHGYV